MAARRKKQHQSETIYYLNWKHEHLPKIYVELTQPLLVIDLLHRNRQIKIRIPERVKEFSLFQNAYLFWRPLNDKFNV
jgi:hypothetical protein